MQKGMRWRLEICVRQKTIVQAGWDWFGNTSRQPIGMCCFGLKPLPKCFEPSCILRSNSESNTIISACSLTSPPSVFPSPSPPPSPSPHPPQSGVANKHTLSKRATPPQSSTVAAPQPKCPRAAARRRNRARWPRLSSGRNGRWACDTQWRSLESVRWGA